MTGQCEAPEGCEWVLMRSYHVADMRARRDFDAGDAHVWASSLRSLNPEPIRPGMWCRQGLGGGRYFVERIVGDIAVVWYFGSRWAVTSYPISTLTVQRACDPPDNAQDLYDLLGITHVWAACCSRRASECWPMALMAAVEPVHAAGAARIEISTPTLTPTSPPTSQAGTSREDPHHEQRPRPILCGVALRPLRHVARRIGRLASSRM